MSVLKFLLVLAVTVFETVLAWLSYMIHNTISVHTKIYKSVVMGMAFADMQTKFDQL